MEIKDEVIFKVNFKQNTPWIFTSFLSLWTVGLLIAMINIIWAIIETTFRFLDFIFPLIIMFLVVLWAINTIMWFIHGIETICITDKIVFTKTGKLFPSKSTIEFFEFEGIYCKEDKVTPFWQSKYRFNGGKIVIKYLGKEIRLGQDISINRAAKVVDEFDAVIEKFVLKN